MKGFGDDLRDKGKRILGGGGKAGQAGGGQPTVPTSSSKGPVTPMGSLALMQPTVDALNERTKEAEQRAAEATKAAEKATQRATELALQLADSPSEASLDELVKIPGRQRKLTEQQFKELVENLRNNPLVHPVAVKRLPDGRFELMSGYNRVEGYEVLGRTSIPISFVDVEEDAVDRTAFFANLIQPSLPDFLKYRGFRNEQNRHEPKLSQADLAKLSGLDRREVSRLFAFEGLPQRALELLGEFPHAMGASCALDLGKLVVGGATEKVIEAVELLVAGKLDQAGAVAHAAKQPDRQPPARALPTKIKSGRFDFCSYVGKGKTLRIDFKEEAQRIAAEAAVEAVLREMAEKG